MIRRAPIYILMIVWSLLNRFISAYLGGVLAIFSDRLRDQLAARKNYVSDLTRIAQKRRDYSDAVLFFCSSAGEYEQASPIIERISESGEVLCHVVFFSVSGARFVEARKDNVSWSMSPLDDARAWHEIFTVLNPSLAVVIRHELWPAFLWVGSSYCEVVVVNAVVPSLFGRQSAWKDKLNVWVKSWLMQFVDQVYVVADGDRDFFTHWLGVKSELVTIAGDTKYDRVLKRQAQKQSSVERIRQSFARMWPAVEYTQTLIVGSAHLPDVQWICSGLRLPSLSAVRLLIVPHDISSGNVAEIFEAFRKRQMSVELLSEIEGLNSKMSPLTGGRTVRVLIADEMGRLSELYGLADLAWVGGAAHHKVHNVLEAAAWGIPVMCGPHYQNSQEAVAMARAGVLHIIKDSESVDTTIESLLLAKQIEGQRARQFAQSMAGATDKVMAGLSSLWSPGSGGVR